MFRTQRRYQKQSRDAARAGAQAVASAAELAVAEAQVEEFQNKVLTAINDNLIGILNELRQMNGKAPFPGGPR